VAERSLPTPSDTAKWRYFGTGVRQAPAWCPRCRATARGRIAAAATQAAVPLERGPGRRRTACPLLTIAMFRSARIVADRGGGPSWRDRNAVVSTGSACVGRRGTGASGAGQPVALRLRWRRHGTSRPGSPSRPLASRAWLPDHLLLAFAKRVGGPPVHARLPVGAGGVARGAAAHPVAPRQAGPHRQGRIVQLSWRPR